MAQSDNLLEVFMALRARIARVVLRIVPPQEVEDIVQETYVRVCQSGNREAIREPRSFLFRTAQNLALDHVKRAETRLTSSSDLIDEQYFGGGLQSEDGTLQHVVSDERFAQFCEAVRRLPRQCRRAFVLKKVYGRTQREIARQMNISENTVENYVALGMTRCRTSLDGFQRTGATKGHTATSTGNARGVRK